MRNVILRTFLVKCKKGELVYRKHYTLYMFKESSGAGKKNSFSFLYRWSCKKYVAKYICLFFSLHISKLSAVAAHFYFRANEEKVL